MVPSKFKLPSEDKVEQELKEYLDENGILQRSGIDKYLEFKGLIRIESNGEKILIVNEKFETPYFDMLQLVKKVQNRKDLRHVGDMGTKKTQNEDINADDIPF